MNALDTSVTLDEVFQVVNAKRVPVAAELAGYLALEIAEGASAGHGAAFDIDPRAVYIGDEGSVALVRPRRDAASAGGGDMEAAVRGILARLLDASGSKTPALGQVASRPSGVGLGVLVEELENALIPVNRAAGRRALARLAREVKRVTQGVGRNAAVSQNAPPPRPTQDATASRSRVPSARDEISDLLNESPVPPPAAVPSPASFRASPPARPQAPPPVAPPPVRPPPTPPAPEPARSGVDELLADFAVSGPHEDDAMARELKALVGLEPTPPPPTSGTPMFPSGSAPAPAVAAFTSSPAGEFIPSSPPPAFTTPAPPPAAAHASHAPPARARATTDDGGIEALLAETANLPSQGGEQPVQIANPDTSAHGPKDRARTRGAVPAREISRSLQDVTKPRPRTDRLLLLLALIIAIAGGAAIFVYRPQLFAPKGPATVDSNGNPVAAPGTGSPGNVETVGDAGAAIRATHDGREATCRGSLVINDAPEGAEVLILEGQAPLDVSSMPIGARLEFVATHDGYAPKRTVVPADAQWDRPAKNAEAGARYEIGVQLDPSKAKAGQVDSWPSAEPGTSVGGDGPPGIVHVASTPKGAEVWLLAGLGPATRIDQIRCDVDVDVLVAGPTTFRQRLHASASDFANAPATAAASGVTVRTVTLSASAAAPGTAPATK